KGGSWSSREAGRPRRRHFGPNGLPSVAGPSVVPAACPLKRDANRFALTAVQRPRRVQASTRIRWALRKMATSYNSPTPQERWHQFSAAAVKAFHRYATWLVKLSWWRFGWYALLL